MSFLETKYLLRWYAWYAATPVKAAVLTIATHSARVFATSAGGGGKRGCFRRSLCGKYLSPQQAKTLLAIIASQKQFGENREP